MLDRVDVLELVDEQVPEPPPLSGGERPVVLDRLGQPEQQVVEVDQAALALLGLVAAVDVGGPDALGPISGVLGGRARAVGGRVLLSVQDDLGLILLVRRFTGADVLLRLGHRQVRGTLRPGPDEIPDLGQVSYRGHDYQAFSFQAQAFPSGSLRVSLLLPRNPTTTLQSVSATSTQLHGIPGPAERAGIKAGDRIVGIDGNVISRWEDLQTYIKARPGTPVTA